MKLVVNQQVTVSQAQKKRDSDIHFEHLNGKVVAIETVLPYADQQSNENREIRKGDRRSLEIFFSFFHRYRVIQDASHRYDKHYPNAANE